MIFRRKESDDRSTLAIASDMHALLLMMINDLFVLISGMARVGVG
jgi:hypothetical protein